MPSENDSFNENDRISEQDKQTILEDSEKILEALQQADEASKDYDEWENKKVDKKGDSSEDYDMNKARKKASGKTEKYQHTLGFHRRYLYPQTKISNIILSIIFIILAIICIVCFLMPGVLPKASI